MTRIYKSYHDGWTAETDLELGNGRFLKIITMKRHNGELVTSARAVNKTDGGYSFMANGDFSRPSIARDKVRCT